MACMGHLDTSITVYFPYIGLFVEASPLSEKPIPKDNLYSRNSGIHSFGTRIFIRLLQNSTAKQFVVCP